MVEANSNNGNKKNSSSSGNNGGGVGGGGGGGGGGGSDVGSGGGGGGGGSNSNSGNGNISAEFMQPGQRRPAKLFHKKSRTGCQRCRARRVKCDEAKPICSNCTRLSLTCVYDRVRAPDDHSNSRDDTSATNSSPSASSSASAPADPPEGEARRKLELSLFYQYFSETAPSIAVDDASAPFLVDVIADMAFESNAILYSAFVVAALHRYKKSNNTDQESLRHCGTYLNMAIREVTHQIAHLSAANIDEVCVTSFLLRVYTFVRLQDRELDEPYAPPVQWLRSTVTSAAVFRRAAELTAGSPQSVGVQMVNLIRHLLDEKKRASLYAGGKAYTAGLLHLVRRQEPHELAEPWDDATRDAYLDTLNYIGGIWDAMHDGDPPSSIARRLIAFPILVDQRFVDVVEEQRPRALVIMAHYFALLSMLRGFWWVGDAGPREVRAIDAQLAPEWRPLMAWPLDVLNDQIVFTRDMEVADQLSEYAAGLRLHM